MQSAHTRCACGNNDLVAGERTIAVAASMNITSQDGSCSCGGKTYMGVSLIAAKSKDNGMQLNSLTCVIL